MNTENNILLADFLGFQKTDLGWFDNEGVLSEVEQDNCFDSLYFDTDWNWLMACIEKIENLNRKSFLDSNNVIIAKNYVVVDYKMGVTKKYTFSNDYLEQAIGDKRTHFNTKIEATYKACIEFVKWFNQQNNEK